ncbi:peptide deformylase [Brumimicrobium glaciale]|uniref:Peptide deformylase n=1 Tax=Brumimicrobium glaciale TaxID=200475 RepID=A0A4Q4KPT2_9FLAO|nr:peptide deformylase [Brumimicrobium glaciale]RYM35548.1 peptide deformylase [Brumimicrobium glaciale]
MKIKSLIPSILILAIMSQSSCSTNKSLTFEIPKKGFKVVQHIPVDAEGRDKNALYLTPRRITASEFNTPELNTFIDTMNAVMLREEGVGIAANQLGKRLQIFIIEAMDDNPRYQVLGTVSNQVFINPIITKVSEERKNFWHGCLSANGEDRGNVATFEWIEYECQNQKGEIQKGRLEGFGAVIFQHEYRHLMKGTYLDHAKHLLPKAELDKKLKSGEVPFFELANDTLPLLIEGYQLGKNLEDY